MSLLQTCHTTEVSHEFPTEWINDLQATTTTPAQVINQRQLQSGIQQVLIKWTDKDISEATWEDAEEIKLRFPDFPTGLEDESNLENGGIDTAHSAAQEQARLEDPQATSRPRRIIKKPSRYLEEL